MNSRERILKALNHEEPDRVPRDLGGTESSGMTAYALDGLCKHLGVEQQLKVFEPFQYVACVGDDLRGKFRIDTANLTPGPKTWVSTTNPLGIEVLLPEAWNEEPDQDGATVVRQSDGSICARRPEARRG